ncbi:hypothetical protein NDU88_007374 [Pleurodeles waltl]|uniref:Uncharacterized protein n=1 Tax=Pleurodeles waltl TaxID=8319 RepID=A0AAV7SSB1_PLEWA|nr:hypothetical protein NDU88_007374 [Pleurodeles waltl]
MRDLFHSAGEWWEWVKDRFLSFFQDASRAAAREKKRDFRQLQSKPQRLFELELRGWDVDDELEETRKGLAEHFREESRKIIFRTRTENLEKDEKCNSFFFKKLHSAHTPLVELRDSEGNLQSGKERVMRVITDFYGELYSPKSSERSQAASFLKGISKTLSPEERGGLNAPFTLEELHLPTTTSKRGKTPRSDGLPVELYVELWDLIGPDLLDLYEEVVGKDSMPQSLRKGMITLFCSVDLTLKSNRFKDCPQRAKSYAEAAKTPGRAAKEEAAAASLPVPAPRKTKETGRRKAPRQEQVKPDQGSTSALEPQSTEEEMPAIPESGPTDNAPQPASEIQEEGPWMKQERRKRRHNPPQVRKKTRKKHLSNHNPNSDPEESEEEEQPGNEGPDDQLDQMTRVLQEMRAVASVMEASPPPSPATAEKEETSMEEEQQSLPANLEEEEPETSHVGMPASGKQQATVAKTTAPAPETRQEHDQPFK